MRFPSGRHIGRRARRRRALRTRPGKPSPKTNALPPQHPRLPGDHRRRADRRGGRTDLHRDRAAGVAARTSHRGAPILVGARCTVACPYRRLCGVRPERGHRRRPGEPSQRGPARQPSRGQFQGEPRPSPQGGRPAGGIRTARGVRRRTRCTARPAPCRRRRDSVARPDRDVLQRPRHQGRRKMAGHLQCGPEHADVGLPVHLGASDRTRCILRRVHVRAR